MEKKKTLVLGASARPSRYSYMAVQRLRQKDHPVIAVGKHLGPIADLEVSKDLPVDEDIDTVTLYLNKSHQQEYHDYLLALKPKRIIFNPGAENPELEKAAAKAGIQTMEACTLVMLGTGQY